MYLHNLIDEIEKYNNQFIDLLENIPDDILWEKPDCIANSIGALARHLAGNLNHYLGAGILKNGYIRDREGEFHNDSIPVETLIKDLKEAAIISRSAIESVNDEMALSKHTTICGETHETLAKFIAKITTHFSYHVGEAYYASKLLPKSN